MYVYCLFCRTQRCSRIAQLLEIKGEGIRRAFSPKILSRQRKQGLNIDRERDLLPGYVFIFSDERLLDYKMFSGIDGVIRRVGRTETGYELEGADREFAVGLFGQDGKVGALKMISVGETVQLENSLFDGSEGVVTKIDYRKERARVDFRFDGNDCHTWIAVDGIRPMKTDQR